MWEEDILARLDDRDKIEKKDGLYFKAFDNIRKRLSEAEAQLGSGKSIDVSNSQIESSNQLHIQINNELAFEVAALKEEIGKCKMNETKQAKTINLLNRKVELLKEEISEKNKTIGLINDEVLSCQIQNNISQQRIDELTKENDALIKRWMNKVKEDAEKMNEVNEILSRTKI